MSSTALEGAARLQKALNVLAKNTDKNLVHASRLLSTWPGIESLLCTTIFTATLLHSQLTRLLSRQYTKLAAALTEKTLLPGETVIASTGPPITTLSQACAATKALADATAEMWMFTRLWGLVHIYKWFRETYDSPPWDPWIKTFTYAGIGAASVFQVIENVAYLSVKGVIRGAFWEKEGKALRWMAVANRFWMAQMVFEGLRLLRVRQLNWDEKIGAESQDGDEKIVKVQSEELKKKWTREFYAICGWLPMTLHWSHIDEAGSPLTETWQGVCGLVPSWIMLQDAWRASA